VEIPLRGADMRMAHQRLDSLEIVPIIQKRRGEGVPHDVGMIYVRENKQNHFQVKMIK